MTKREKREATIRVNPKNVRFSDLDLVLKHYHFSRSQPGGGSSHYTYNHSDLPDILTIPFNQPFIKRPYVMDALRAIDAVQEIAAERERDK